MNIGTLEATDMMKDQLILAVTIKLSAYQEGISNHQVHVDII